MRLTHVEAVRYGELTDTVLGIFGGDLTVVYGRNEAGKSTFSSLIRHLLYGFPRGRTTERQYLVPSGDSRVGRLVFDVGGGDSLVIERTEGAHGGQVTAMGEQGEESGEAVLGVLTAGVSAGVFRGVFGFSLEELSDLSSLEDIQSKLYATSAGLRVNPHDVLEKLHSDADVLWAPRARTREIHQLNNSLKSLREDRRKLDEAAEEYRLDRERRAVVAAELEAAEKVLEDCRHEEARQTALHAEASRLQEGIEDDEAEIERLHLEESSASRESESLEVDEELLDRATGIERLIARLELFRSDAAQLETDLGKSRELRLDLDRLAAELGEGWNLDTVAEMSLGVELENKLHESEERLRESQRRREDDARRATEARNERDEAHRRALELTKELGIEREGGLSEAVGTRLETVDRLLTLGHGPETRGPSFLPAMAGGTIAAAFLIAGLVLDENLLLIASATILLFAIGLAVPPVLYRRRVPTQVEELLPVLGLDEPPTATELMELKNRLEESRRLWTVEAELAVAAAARDEVANESAQAHDRAWRGWIAWLDDHHLHTRSDRPEGVRRLLAVLREMKAGMTALAELETDVDRRRGLCEDYAAQAREAGASLPARDEGFDISGIEQPVRALIDRFAASREGADARRELEGRIATAAERRSALEARLAKNRVRSSKIFESSRLGDTASFADLDAATTVARRKAAEAEAERDRLLEERATLDGRLQRGADESASAELRLAESGLIEQIRDALEVYAIKATAASLLEESLKVYEAERQPGVIQRAQEIFSNLTDGRYSKITTPLGSFEPMVSDGRSIGKPPQSLSRATAEQLFLALRLSYIENLSGAHPALPVLMDDVLVNFDDDRRSAAAAVVAEFAERRQVLFFTCHPATVDAFAGHAPGCTLLELGGASG